MAQEVALNGVTVNSVCPGPTDTPMWRSDPDEEWKRWKIESLPMRRLGQPIEIAWAYVYLASDEAKLHWPEHFTQWRRRYVVRRLDATTHRLCVMMPGTRGNTLDHEDSAVRRLS